MEYCYAVCLSNGVVKFGRTSDLHSRIQHHVNAAASHGIMCMCALVSGSMSAVEDERSMISVAEATLERQEQGNEYFKGTPEDAIFVMTQSGLLPITTYPDKESTSGALRFVVARVGVDFTSYKVVRKKSPEPQKVLSVLKENFIGEGVIRNRCKRLSYDEVAAQLSALVREGVVEAREHVHPINRKPCMSYRLKPR